MLKKILKFYPSVLFFQIVYNLLLEHYSKWDKTTLKCPELGGTGVRVMVFNANFNNIAFISCLSVLLMEETGENHRPVVSH